MSTLLSPPCPSVSSRTTYLFLKIVECRDESWAVNICHMSCVLYLLSPSNLPKKFSTEQLFLDTLPNQVANTRNLLEEAIVRKNVDI